MLSIIIPVYNEDKRVQDIIARVNILPIEKEIIVVDDCSKDNTAAVLRSFSLEHLRVIHHATKRGKGAAVRTGVENAAGDFVLIHDLDLDHEPGVIPKLLEVVKSQQAEIALGIRLSAGQRGKIGTRLVNRLVSMFLNLFYWTKLSGWFSGYLLMRRQDFLGLVLESNGEDVNFEILTKALDKKMRIKEVPGK